MHFPREVFLKGAYVWGKLTFRTHIRTSRVHPFRLSRVRRFRSVLLEGRQAPAPLALFSAGGSTNTTSPEEYGPLSDDDAPCYADSRT